MNSEPLPRLRILHHMARSGGTLFSRCLASMDGVALLSEIHPQGVRTYNPLEQARRWYGLVDDGDLQAIREQRAGFTDVIGLIESRCAERGKTLLLRDWSHLDYIGVPFALPGFRSKLAGALSQAFELRRFSTVRHPMDQWLSLMRFPVFRNQVDPAAFMRGYLSFCDMAHETGFVRYEDLVAEPDGTLQQVCAALELDFDPTYAERYPDYRNVTGDIALGGRAGGTIEKLSRIEDDSELARRLAALDGYALALERMGYE